jgi:hypothetical protein
MIRLIRLIYTGTMICVRKEDFFGQTNKRKHYERYVIQQKDNRQQIPRNFNHLLHDQTLISELSIFNA